MKLRSITYWMLFVFVVSIPSTNVIRIASLGSLSRLIGVLAIALGVVALFGRNTLTFRMPSLFLVFASLYTLFVISTYFWTQNVSATISQMITFAQLTLMAWLIWEFARDEAQRRTLMQGFILGALIALISAANTIFTAEDYVFRELGDAFDANEFATVLAMSIVMAWHLALTAKNKLTVWANTLFLPIAIFGVVMSASRGGLIVTLIALTIIPLTYTRLGTFRKLAIFAVISVAIWGVFIYFPQVFPEWQQNLERLAGTSEELQSGSWTGRLYIYDAGFKLFWDNPYLGIGGGAFASSVEPILGRAMVAHNTYLSVATEGGIVGLLLFLLILVSVAPSVLGQSHRSRIFTLVLFAVLVAGIVPLTAEKAKYVWFVLAILAGEKAPISGRFEAPVAANAPKAYAKLS